MKIEDFGKKYILYPNSPELSKSEKIKALIFSIAIGIFSLGIVHIVVLCVLRQKKINDLKKKENNNVDNGVEKPVIAFKKVFPAQVAKTLPIKAKDIPDMIQNDFITQYYSKELPAKDRVKVPFNGQAVLWQQLSNDEKIDLINSYALPHDQIGSIGRLFVDRKFFTSRGQEVFLPNDPRRHHGSDHCVRASLFAPVFAYLYEKYDPDCAEISQDQLTLMQIAAAGHDSARQTEGPDLYDEWSSEQTVEVLKKHGIQDKTILEDVRKAIAEKDCKKFESKGIIAKCVQNADCAEFARLLLKSSVQDTKGFDNSRGYLDVYQEISKKQKPLKNGHTKEEFYQELDSLRKEMNKLIFATHSEEARKGYSSASNYYNAVAATINEADYPSLFKILQIKKITR